MSNRYTMLMRENGSEWVKVYDGCSRKVFLRNFVHWARITGVELLVVCPLDADPALKLDYPAKIDLRTYPGR